MSQGNTSSAGEILFCQRNNRLWVTVLIGSAVAVLVLAVVLAYEDGKFIGWKHGQAHPAVAPSYPTITPSVPAQGSPQAAGQTVAAWAPVPAAGATADPVAAVPAAPAAAMPSAANLSSSFNQVAQEIRPCVVNINAVRGPTRGPPGRGQAQFVDPFDGVPDKMIGGVAFESVGSGLIIDPRGYVVTNDHLISGATTIMVTRFQTTEPLPAQLITSDPGRDLALLKIQGDGPYPAARLANSDDVRVGDWVLAIGNPFGLAHTVTAGIVHSRRSSMKIGDVVYKNLLQTDVPINQGSSGGPLVNLRARVVGINTAIYAPTGVFNGTGFAIPSNQVGAFVSRAVPAGSSPGAATTPSIVPTATTGAPAPGPKLGLTASDVTPALAAKLGLASGQGVFVNAVDPGTPAEQAGLRRGDVIVEIGGNPIANTESLQATLNSLPAGTTAGFVIQRGNDRVEQPVTLGYVAAPAQTVRGN